MLSATALLLPIKPQYVELILAGKKKYEYRKKLPTKPVCKIIIYVTQPICQVVGEVEVIDVMKMDKQTLWESTKANGGVSKSEFDNYFKNNEQGCAFQLGKVTTYPIGKTLKELGINYIVQNWVYL